PGMGCGTRAGASSFFFTGASSFFFADAAISSSFFAGFAGVLVSSRAVFFSFFSSGALLFASFYVSFSFSIAYSVRSVVTETPSSTIYTSAVNAGELTPLSAMCWAKKAA
ncbi:MAG: hypothetical protein IJR00_04860, partial [Lachnospiraceae bacterium]|nr:hypothetical protein [Lachnospiraceae bacterium]